MKMMVVSPQDETTTLRLMEETRAVLLDNLVSSHVSGWLSGDVQSEFVTLLPEPRTTAEKIRLRVGWLRSECVTIGRLLEKARKIHEDRRLFLSSPSTDTCARLRAEWLRMIRDSSTLPQTNDRAQVRELSKTSTSPEKWITEHDLKKVENLAMQSLKRESKDKGDYHYWHRLEDVVQDVLRDLRSRVEDQEPTIHEIERWMKWLNDFVLPLVAVRAKSISLARLHPTTLDLLSALRNAQTGSGFVRTSDAVREWVKAGMPDTIAK